MVLADSLPLVIGQGLLDSYNLGIGELFVVDTSGAGVDAGPDDLGERVKLYWVSEEEKAAL